MADRSSPRQPMFDIKKVCEALDAMAEDIAQELLPRGRWEIKGSLWMDARTSAGGMGDALKVNVKTGRWRHYSQVGKFGDMLELACYVNGWSKSDALRWALREKLRWIGPDGKALPAPNRPQLATRPPVDPLAEREDLETKRRKADALWVAGQASLLGTPAGIMLEQRGIELGKLYEQKLGLGALRYHPEVFCSNLSDPDRGKWVRIPAMLAKAIRPNGKIATVHRTYLIERAPGKWDRYREDRDGWDGKKNYSKLLGGVVPIWRGRRHDADGVIRKGHRYTDPKAGPEIDLTEGLENALSIACVDSDLTIAAALSMPNACMLRLPEHFTRRWWWRDRDDGNVNIEGDENREGLWSRLVAHLGAAPNELKIVDPPDGLKDTNDALKPDVPSNNQAEDAGSQRRLEEGPS